MVNVKLDESDGASPLYSQVAYHIELEVDKGKILVGEKLPSQNELAKRFGVSRITILKALELLRNNGLIVSKQGKGSIVVKAGDTRTYQSEGFSARYSQLGKIVSTKIESITIEESDSEISKNLLLIPKSKVIHIMRVRYLDDRPISVEHSHICYKQKTYDVIKQLKENDSLYKTLSDNLGIRLSYAEESLCAELPNEENQRLLKIDKHHPIIKMNRLTYENLEDPPVEFCRNYYNNETYGNYGIVSIKLQSHR